MSETEESFSALLRNALGARLAPGAQSYLEMFAEDGVMEFPYAAPGMAREVRGRKALSNYLASVGGELEFDRMSKPTVHETADPEVVILEFEAFGRGTQTNKAYHQQYISVVRVRNGHIILYRDYWNPLSILRALKGASYTVHS